MARVTVEDCEKYVDNRFDLVLLAAKRARQICAGSPEMVEGKNDKNTVIALREIAEGVVNSTTLSQAISMAKDTIEDDTQMEIMDMDMVVLDSDSIMLKTGIEITEKKSESTAPMFEDVNEEDIID